MCCFLEKLKNICQVFMTMKMRKDLQARGFDDIKGCRDEGGFGFDRGNILLKKIHMYGAIADNNELFILN